MALDMRFDDDDEGFREEVRAFLAAELPDELREAARRQTGVFPERDVALRWQRILHGRGWVAPNWPPEFGGPGWSPTQRWIFAEESARAGAPGLVAMGIALLGPVLFRYGTPEQQAEYLPRILSGEHYWCQGYSEPGSGSDLSSLRTQAVRDGDHYVVTGTKLWTTHAHHADHIFCLVRTDAAAKPQAGISFLLVDMATPGITVEPVITLAGEHEVNQVVFDGVRVPVANRVGEENDGWTVAKYLLEFERGSTGATPALRVAFGELRRLAGRDDGAGGSLLDDAAFAARVHAVEVDLRAQEFAELRTLARLAGGERPGPESSLAKNAGVALKQRIDELMLEAVDWYGVPHHVLLRLTDANAPPVGPADVEPVNGRFLNNRAASIYGGSREVQKNIVARAVLGL